MEKAPLDLAAFRLVRVSPLAVGEIWSLIRQAVIRSTAPGTKLTEENLSNVLSSLLSERMLCWTLAEYDDEGKAVGLYMIGTTTIVTDTIADTKSLLIYSLYGLKMMSEELWKKTISLLSEYAKGQGCVSVMATTANRRMLKVAEGMGVSTDLRMITIGLGD